MFKDYPDIITVKQLCEMLGGIGEKAAYRLLHDGHISHFKIGKGFRIPKRSVIAFLSSQKETNETLMALKKVN